MAEFTQQDIQNLNKTLENINTKLGAARTAGARAGGGGTPGGSGEGINAFARLYKTVSDADSAIQKPFSQAGQALQNLGDVTNGIIPDWLPFGDSVKGFVSTITAGGKVLADHNQKLLDFSQGLSGSAGLSINSFAELTKQLGTANLGMADFQRVQGDAANFLSTMGGELRSVAGQARLLADITNVVNDDFEKLGQMGVSLAEKQQMQADSMVLLRQIGMDSGTTAEQAAQMVSGAMQNMAMEGNKMAALTGQDRRKTMASMQEKMKGDADLAITAELVAEAHGHTAEQAATTRQNFANLDGVMSAMGPAGEKLKAVMAEAAETGVPFITLLGRAEPKLAQLISGNDDYINGIQGLVDKATSGKVLGVEEIAEAQKGLAASVNNDVKEAALLSSEWKEEFRNLKLAEVRTREFSLKAAKNVELDTEKGAKSSSGQAANMAQVMKDGLTQATNVADTFKTIGTELFNKEFVAEAKTMRDAIKSSGSDILNGLVGARDTLMGSRDIVDNATDNAIAFMGYSNSETDMAKEKLENAMLMLGMDKKEMSAWADAAGIGEVHAGKMKALSDAEAKLREDTNKKAKEMVAAMEEGTTFTDEQMAVAAKAIGADVADLQQAISNQQKSNEDSKAEKIAQMNQSITDQLNAMNESLQADFLEAAKSLQDLQDSTDAAYDARIEDMITGENSAVAVNKDLYPLLSDIKESSNTNKLVEEVVRASQVNKDEGGEQAGIIAKLDGILKVLMDMAGASDSTQNIENQEWYMLIKQIAKNTKIAAENTN